MDIDDVLAAIGMGNARALFAAHNDEGYAHLHIVASKINPDTGRAYDLKGNWLKLSRWAEAYEREHSGGIVCSRREEANQLRDAVGKRDAATIVDLTTQQRATFRERDLDRVLFKQVKDSDERGAFVKEILTRPEIVSLSDVKDGPVTRYTTKSVLEAERQVLRASDGLAGDKRHGVDEKVRAKVLGAKEFDGISREQARAYARRWMLQDDEQVDRAVTSLEGRVWRPLESCYPAGLEFCRRFTSGDPARFRKLLHEQITPAA